MPGSGVLGNDTDADNDPLNAVLMTLPLHGMLTFNAGGSFTYTPTLNYAGPDSFTYRANDGVDSGNIATVNLLVNQVNDPPFTMADSFTAVLNQPLDVPAPGVLANDRDVEVEDTAPLTAQLVSGPSHGVLQLNSDGSFSYLPAADFLGTDSFVYASKDHFGAVSLSPKTVTLMVALKAVSAVVSGGATVETGGPVSAGDPLRSQVTTPTPATVSIAQGVISGADSPTGYSFLNQQVNITVTGADGAEVTASPSNPLVFVFEIDLSLVPARTDPRDVPGLPERRAGAELPWRHEHPGGEPRSVRERALQRHQDSPQDPDHACVALEHGRRLGQPRRRDLRPCRTVRT